MKTIEFLLTTRPWIAHIDDERKQGNSIIVTLKDHWYFVAENRGGVRGFDTLIETEQGTRKKAVYQGE